MFSIVFAIHMATITTSANISKISVRQKQVPAKSWNYKIRRDLWDSHLFNKAFPQNWWEFSPGASRTQRASDGYPKWTRWNFAVLTQRVLVMSQHTEKPVPDHLLKEIQQLKSEYRKELEMLDKVN